MPCALVDDNGQPVTDGTVIVFAEEAAKWALDSRQVRTARPDQQGKWRINGLPSGRFLAVAVEYVESGMWNDPEYLESLRRLAQRLEMKDRDQLTIALRFVTP